MTLETKKTVPGKAASVTRLGEFWKFLEPNSVSKVTQMYVQHKGLF